ncbi:CDGSH iron-sulfur domain-containing protein [Nocardiopsis flavescens]|uniref:Iron-binding zinc finger CDGSH type n=1 Tax=Nocardiopsis flavescens TaxID=758803 RepID=A0A1M6JFM2_9ACTN|nr:CDGSH iron-sulfur domain-containing protein [Nocardiopsis flavescens]SHJ45516.1 Iron-binding zinc finger CDGSH type [Nocardiopsis flavescens]
MDDDRRRVVVTGEGPVLIYGPVDVEMPDGTRVPGDRAVTALCTCGRSRRSPFCDTSHRRRVRDRREKEDDT